MRACADCGATAIPGKTLCGVCFARHEDAVRASTRAMPWEFNDGGRVDAGYHGRAGDCVVRSIAIATGREYRTVYLDLMGLMRPTAKRERDRSPRNGVPTKVIREYLNADFPWTPHMGIGTGCTVHLTPAEVPMRGSYVIRLSRHLTALMDGIVQDTHDPSRGGTRCVYGWWEVER